MDRDIAKDILPLVNDYDFNEMLKDYAQYRIDKLRVEMDTLPVGMIEAQQGAIKELKRLLSLKDEVLIELKKD